MNKTPLEEELRFANSYTRLPIILKRYSRSDRQTWFRLLGEEWEACDNVGRYSKKLRNIFSSATRDDLDAMMTPTELTRWQALPDSVTAYRGCYFFNCVSRFSFSLDKAVASKFPTLTRYRVEGQIPL